MIGEIIQCHAVYFVDGKLYGYVIDEKPARLAIRDFWFSWDLKGQSAHFVIVSNDKLVGRKTAIDYAAAIHGGKYKTIHIDLSEIGKIQVKDKRKW